MIDVCSLPHGQHIAVIFAAQFVFMAFEAWLGKTKKIEAGSTLEIIFNLLTSFFKRNQ